MIVKYNTKKLEKLANDENKFLAKYGEQVKKKFYMRISAMISSENLKDLMSTPGKHHPLEGKRLGQWACSLTANYRLIYRPIDESEELNNGKIEKPETIIEVSIEEIVDYH